MQGSSHSSKSVNALTKKRLSGEHCGKLAANSFQQTFTISVFDLTPSRVARVQLFVDRASKQSK